MLANRRYSHPVHGILSRRNACSVKWQFNAEDFRNHILDRGWMILRVSISDDSGKIDLSIVISLDVTLAFSVIGLRLRCDYISQNSFNLIHISWTNLIFVKLNHFSFFF